MSECEKTRYPTERAALDALSDITVRGMQGDRRGPLGWGHQPVAVYECPICGAWHLTSRPGRISRRKGDSRW